MADKKYEKTKHEDTNVVEERIRDEKEELDANRDPITGEPGAHPFGVAGGGASGAITGVAIGAAVGGPIGAAVGGALGAVAGGLAGKAAAEALNPTTEDAYWRENYKNRPYYREGTAYEDYEPAYRYGWESASRTEYRNRRFEDVEQDLQRAWEGNPDYTNRSWKDVRDASRDSYDRAYTQLSDTSEIPSKGSFWNQLEGNWLQIKGNIKERWNLLTDDEVDEMEGRREQIIGKIQEKYGEKQWTESRIERELQKINEQN
jgi:uncharacterized protein YjbJ (UPF0337 family)